MINPAFDPKRWLVTVASERVTRSTLVPTMVNMIVNHPAVAEHDLSSLDAIVYAGSPMPHELLRRAMELLPCQWIQAYGMTEAAPLVTCLSADDHRRGAVGAEPRADVRKRRWSSTIRTDGRITPILAACKPARIRASTRRAQPCPVL